MFIKEIFSKKKKIIIEILHKKAFIEKMYEKSYIRGLLSNSSRIHVLDNNSLFFNTKKSTSFKTNPNPIQQKEIDSSYTQVTTTYDSDLKKSVKIEYKGYSSYSTTFLYKNRKSNFLRFQLPLCTINKSKKFLDSFIKGFEKLSKTRIIKGENNLIFLSSNKGGFICYSSGFQGFLPKSQFKYIILDWIKNFGCLQKNLGLQTLKSFIQSQKFQFSISPPPRFSFTLKKTREVINFRRKRFLLSRKKRFNLCTTVAINMIFYSKKKTADCNKKLNIKKRIKRKSN